MNLEAPTLLPRRRSESATVRSPTFALARCPLLLSLAVALCSLAAPVTTVAQDPGWRRIDLGSGRYARRFLPRAVRACDPLPLVVFFHGAGGSPEHYERFVEADAEALGLVLLMPKSAGAGWSDADVPAINAALEALESEIHVDPTRVHTAGHSAGGAFAYILGYGSPGIAAIFSMSAPFYRVDSVADPAYRPPIRMYYGADDPNYTGGSAAALEAQWRRLGVEFETDVQAGHGHSSWPPSSMRAGLEFLRGRRAPGTTPASRCGGPADAGTGPPDASAALDATGPAGDAGAALDEDSGALEAATGAEPRTPTRRARGASGCACRTNRGRISSDVLHAVLVAAIGLLVRLRRTGFAQDPTR